MTHRIRINNLDAQFPSSPSHAPECAVNVVYKTVPESGNAPGCSHVTHPTLDYEDIAVGSASIKHLYSGVGNFYPPQRIRRPINSLYGHDLSQFAENGKRMSYHYKVWPLTHRHVRETREYSPYTLPYMDNREWTRYPVETDVGTGRWYP